MKKRRLCPVTGLLLAATCAALESLALPMPALWYNAETGITADDDGNVTKWANEGSLGSVGDVAPAATATSVKFNRASTLSGYCAVAFGTNSKFKNYLVTASAFGLGLTKANGVTWFYVCDFLDNSYLERTTLFGADISTASTHPFSALYNTDSGVEGLQAKLGKNLVSPADVDSAHKPGRRLLAATGGGSSCRVFVCSLPDTMGAWTQELSSIPAAKFMLGADGHTGFYDFKGHMGEFRLYPTQLTAAERFAVEGELAARHHFDLTPEAETTITAALLKKHSVDPNAIGDQPTGGKAVSPVPVSAASGALTVSLTSTPAATDTALVYFAHDGETGVRRTWCVAGTTAARAIPLKLAFDAAEYPTLDCACLRRRSDGDSAWTAVVGATFAKTPTALEFVLPAGWQNGQYCLVPGSVLAPETLLDTTVNDADTWNTTGYGNALPVTEYAETVAVESTVRLVYPSAVLQVFDSFRTGSFFTVE